MLPKLAPLLMLLIMLLVMNMMLFLLVILQRHLILLWRIFLTCRNCYMNCGTNPTRNQNYLLQRALSVSDTSSSHCHQQKKIRIQLESFLLVTAS